MIRFNFHGVQNFPPPPPPPGGDFDVTFLPGGGFQFTVPAGQTIAVTTVVPEQAAEEAEIDEAINQAILEVEQGGAVNYGLGALFPDPMLGILNHSVNNKLSATQVLYLLLWDNTMQVQGPVLTRREEGIYMYPTVFLRSLNGHSYVKRHRRTIETLPLGAAEIQIDYKYSVARHPRNHPNRVITIRRYFVADNGPRFLVHYRDEEEVLARQREQSPRIPVNPIIHVPLAGLFN